MASIFKKRGRWWCRLKGHRDSKPENVRSGDGKVHKVHMRREKAKRRYGVWTGACGVGVFDETLLSWQQFVCLPERFQCGRCLNTWRGVDRHVHVLVEGKPLSASQDVIDAMELFLVALSAYVTWAGRREVHTCYHRPYKHVEGTTRCQWHEHREVGGKEFIGKRSVLDVLEWWYPVGFDDVTGCVRIDRAAA